MEVVTSSQCFSRVIIAYTYISRELARFCPLLTNYLFPSIQPGNGSDKVLSIVVGRMMITGSCPFVSSTTISPIALLNEYVFAHPYFCALFHQSLFVKRRNTFCSLTLFALLVNSKKLVVFVHNISQMGCFEVPKKIC